MELTQFGIDELARQGVDVTGLSVGYPATDDMRRRLGIQDDVDPGALPDPVSAAQVAEGMATTLDPQASALNAGSMDPAAVAGAMNAASPPAPVTQEQLTAPKSGGLISGFGDMLFGPQETTDQFSNLNRQQRMMLAFGAIKDAGFALQGKEGSAFSNTLKAINDQIDMGRKAKAAEQERKAISQLLGLSEGAQPAVGTPAAPGDVGDARAELARLESQMGAFAQMGQMDFYNQKHAQLTSKIEAEKAAATEIEEEAKLRQGKIAGYEQTISVAENALMASGGFDSVEDLRKAIEADEFDPSSFILSRQNFWPDSPAFKDFQSAANQFAAIMTFQNLGAIVDQGIKLGTLSDADLKIIGNQSGEIDPINRPEQTARNILQVYRSVSKTRKAMAASEDTELGAMLKKYNITD